MDDIIPEFQGFFEELEKAENESSSSLGQMIDDVSKGADNRTEEIIEHIESNSKTTLDRVIEISSVSIDSEEQNKLLYDDLDDEKVDQFFTKLENQGRYSKEEKQPEQPEKPDPIDAIFDEMCIQEKKISAEEAAADEIIAKKHGEIQRNAEKNKQERQELVQSLEKPQMKIQTKEDEFWSIIGEMIVPTNAEEKQLFDKYYKIWLSTENDCLVPAYKTAVLTLRKPKEPKPAMEEVQKRKTFDEEIRTVEMKMSEIKN